MDLAEIRRPPCFTDRFEHFDRDDTVERSGDFAIVAQLQIDFGAQTGMRNAFASKRQLFLRQRNSGHARIGVCDMRGQRAPAAADFEHACPWCQGEQIDNAIKLLRLRRFE